MTSTSSAAATATSAIGAPKWAILESWYNVNPFKIDAVSLPPNLSRDGLRQARPVYVV